MAHDPEKSVDYWWIVLSTAVREGDLEKAADAQQRLLDMGVEVTFSGLKPEGTTNDR